MEQKTKNSINWLIWAVWIAAGLCLAAVILLVILVVTRRNEPAEVQAPSSAAVFYEEEDILPEETELPEPTRPILDLVENPYTAEDFDFRGRYLECTAGPCKIGIDVSSWQDEVNWTLVKAAGMEFTMIRLGFRGNTEGAIKADGYAAENYRGAKDAGLEVGVYFFSQAITPEEAVEEAEFVLDMVQDWKLELPIVFDWERSANRTAHTDARTLTDCALAFCQTIEDAGYEAMVYFNTYQAYNDIYLEELKEYDFWLALYESEMTFPYQIDMWQYSATGSVPGIEGSVDLNILFEYE